MLFFEINCKLSIEENSIYKKKCVFLLHFSIFVCLFVFFSELQLLLIGPFGAASVTVYLFRVPDSDLYKLWELMLENYLVLF